MLEAMVTFIVVIIGAVLIIFVLGYGIYITFYPLSKTVKGGIDAIDAMKEHVKEKKVVEEEKEHARTSTGRSRRALKGRRTSANIRKE
jgi:hypothetical protein